MEKGIINTLSNQTSQFSLEGYVKCNFLHPWNVTASERKLVSSMCATDSYPTLHAPKT
jgi:hypothetical protein